MRVWNQGKQAKPLSNSPGRAPLQNMERVWSSQIKILIPNCFFLGRRSRHAKYWKALNWAQLRDVIKYKVKAEHWLPAFLHYWLIVKDVIGLAGSRNRAPASHINKGKVIPALGSQGICYLTAAFPLPPSWLLKWSAFAIKILCFQ